MARLNEKITIRLSEEDYKWLEYLALTTGYDVSDVIRVMIGTFKLIFNSGDWYRIYNKTKKAFGNEKKLK
ncbi:MAG: hypothetical protein ACPLVI_06875 [Thermoplasmata archaeon]